MTSAILCAGRIGLLLGALCVPPVPAQTYPSKPVQLVVPYPAGGVVDALMRSVGQPVAAPMNEAFVQAVRSPRFQEQVLNVQAFDAVGSSPPEFADFLRADRAHAKRVVQMTGIRLEDAPPR